MERLRKALPEESRPSYGTVYRICKENGLLQKRRRPRGLTRQNPLAQASEDLIKRDFTATAPNRKWLSDITQISCKDGILYIAAILDCFDGALVGLSVDTHKRAELCTAALQNAIGRYGKSEGLILHSDRGSQYTSRAFRSALRKQGLLQSMGRTGSCFDNARMESFFATLKKELIYRLPLSTLTRVQVRRIVFEWIHFYYNFERLTSMNDGFMPPLVKRKLFLAQLPAAA